MQPSQLLKSMCKTRLANYFSAEEIAEITAEEEREKKLFFAKSEKIASR